MKRFLCLVSFFLLVVCTGTTASAMLATETIAYTGFEEPAASTGKYTQVGTVGDALPAQSGVTTSYTGGTELGFETYLISGEGPLASDESTGDYIGVSDYYSYNGDNNYEIEDADDVVELRVDTVELTEWVDVTVSAYLKVEIASYTGYESDDYVTMSVLTDIGTYYLCDLDATELQTIVDDDDYAYIYYSVDLPDTVTSGQFILTVGTNGSGEGVQLDDVYFSGTYSPVPVPGAVWLLGSGLLAAVGVRRKNR